MQFIRDSLSRYKNLPREIYILFFARVINFVGAFVFPLLTLLMTDKIGISERETGFYLMLITTLQAPAMFFGGRLTDRVGRKKVIVLFQVLGASTYVVCGLLPMHVSTVYLIMLASMFFSLAQPAMDAVTCDITNAANRKEAYAMLYMGLNLGFAIGPVLAGLLYKDHLPWIFFGDALTMIISTLLFAFFIPETKPQEDAETINELEKFEEGSVWQVFKKRPVILIFSLIQSLYFFSYSQCTFGLPLYMNELFGADGARNFGLVSGLNGLVVIIFTPIVTSLMKRFRSITGLIIGGLLYAVSFGAMAFTSTMPMFYLWMFVLTIGEIVNMVDSSAFVANFSPASHRGRVNSITMIIRQSGRALGPFVMGALIATKGSTFSWYVTGLVVFAGALLMAVLKFSNRQIRQYKHL